MFLSLIPFFALCWSSSIIWSIININRESHLNRFLLHQLQQWKKNEFRAVIKHFDLKKFTIAHIKTELDEDHMDSSPASVCLCRDKCSNVAVRAPKINRVLAFRHSIEAKAFCVMDAAIFECRPKTYLTVHCNAVLYLAMFNRNLKNFCVVT